MHGRSDVGSGFACGQVAQPTGDEMRRVVGVDRIHPVDVVGAEHFILCALSICLSTYLFIGYVNVSTWAVVLHEATRFE